MTSMNIGFNPIGINGMNPAPEFTPITAPEISGYHFPEGDEPLPSTPASQQQHAHEGDTHEHTHADGGGSLLYNVISATLVAVAAATGLGIVVHLVNTPELQMIFEALKKNTAKGPDVEPNWVKGLPAFSFPHGDHGQTPGAPAASSGDQATPQQQAAWAHPAASSSSAPPTYPSGINHVPLPAPSFRPGRPGERPPPSTYAGAPEAAARQAADAAFAALPRVKLIGKQTKEQQRDAIIAHGIRLATADAAAAAAERRRQAEAEEAARVEQQRRAQAALAKPPRRVREEKK